MKKHELYSYEQQKQKTIHCNPCYCKQKQIQETINYDINFKNNEITTE